MQPLGASKGQQSQSLKFSLDPSFGPSFIPGVNLGKYAAQGSKLMPYKKVLQNLSFSIKKGQVHALVGESGSGKSMSALAIMGLLPTKARLLGGEILFRGQNLLAMTPRELRALRGKDIAMIFQEPINNLNPLMKVKDQCIEALLAHSLCTRREARARLAELLDKAQVKDVDRVMNSYPHELSGGLCQRVMIAAALSTNPELLIADEPTTALDASTQAHVLEILRMLQDEQQMSVLFITHDMGAVAALAQEISVMRDGVVVEQGSMCELLLKPKDGYTKELLRAVPNLGDLNDCYFPQKFATHEEGECRELNCADYTQPPVLSIRDLSVSYEQKEGLFGRKKSFKAARNISLELFPKETVAIVGQSGSGKSSFARALIGLAPKEALGFSYQGLNMQDPRVHKAKRGKIGMIFQDPFSSLNPRMSAGACVAEPLLVHKKFSSYKEAIPSVKALFAQVGLEPDLLHRYPHEFSGGQRQRIAIARALALKPSVIIADEAVSALDLCMRASVINLLLDLQLSHGISYIFISHDMAVVERMANRVFVMYQGVVVEQGFRCCVFNEPKHSYTKHLLSCALGKKQERLKEYQGLLPRDLEYEEFSRGHLALLERDER